MVLDVASEWFKEHAYFNVPKYERPYTTVSSGGLKRTNVDHLGKGNMPVFAFEDETKVQRLIQATDDVLRDHRLAAPDGNRKAKDSAVRKAYEELFSPQIEAKYGVKYDEWVEIFSEADCLELVRRGLIYAVKFVVKKMFKKNITSCTEPKSPGTLLDEFKERVDMVIMGENNTDLYLVEGETPAAMDKFDEHVSTSKTHEINLKHSASPGENVLNKSMSSLLSNRIREADYEVRAIHYMRLWDCDYLMLTSFEKVYFLQCHRDEENSELSISYSTPIEQDGKSDVFRALLGLTLHRLGMARLDGPPLRKYRNRFLLQRDDDDNAGAGPSAGPISGSGRSGGGGYDYRPNPGKRFFSSIIGKGTGGASNYGTKRRHGTNTLQVCSPESHKLTIDLPRPMSWRPELWEKTDVKDTGSIIKIAGCDYLGPDLFESAEFDFEPGVKFPFFPTSDEVPILQVVQLVGEGATGLVYRAKLVHPDNSDDTDDPSYAIKLVDARWRSREYRNYNMDLHNEYINYCLLELGKRYQDLANIIKLSTATCYGLYRLRDYSPDSLPKFVLIIEYLGERVQCMWKGLGDSEKCAVLDTLICLHALGLKHNDADERNVVFDNKSERFKFIDLCTSSWHKCRGIHKCVELRIMWNKFNLLDVGLPRNFQENVIHDHNLVFCNVRERLEQAKDVDVEVLATSVKDLAEELEPDM